jgi:iron(III) transport system substrate-binding protein
LQQVMQETQANLKIADVLHTSDAGHFVLLKEKKLLTAYTPAGVERFPAGFKDKDGYYFGLRATINVIAYNTKQVTAADAPKTWKDLLDPKWKGKMAWNAGSDASGAFITITTLLRTWGEQRTDAYLARLAKQDITPLLVSNRQVVDQVILGEYWIGIGISAHHPIISAGRGAPSATVLFDPIPSLNDSIQVLKGTRHPHAVWPTQLGARHVPAQRSCE